MSAEDTGQSAGAPIRVWRACADDAPDVTRLLVGFRDWWQRDWPPQDMFALGVQRLISDPDTDYLLAGIGDQPPCGVAQLRYRYSVWVNALDCYLEDLFIEKHARSGGVGRALVQAAFDHAKQRGSARIELDVNEANLPALALYESLGFSAWSDPPGANNLLARRSLTVSV
jgi:ribosomal protein S18 acetylase RimI-like enzyme